MSPRAQRSRPLHQQIADWFAERITAGAEGFREGDQLPPIRVTAQEWGVGYQAAQHAYEMLNSMRLTESRGTSGTFVLPARNTMGPQRRARSAIPSADEVTVRYAGLWPAEGDYAYVRPILGTSAAVSHVIRREELWLKDGEPYMLAVTWVPAVYAQQVPELAVAEPLPDSRGAAYLIASRTGQRVSWGRSAVEARPVRDDDREAPALGLDPDGCVLAETHLWGARGKVLEYGESVIGQGRVIETDMTP